MCARVCVYRAGAGGQRRPRATMVCNPQPYKHMRSRGPRRRRRSLSTRVLTAHISAQAGGLLTQQSGCAAVPRGRCRAYYLMLMLVMAGRVLDVVMLRGAA